MEANPSASTPVPRSAVGSTFEEPLSTGLSVADVVENALLSVVQIIAGSGAGTGFIINEDGLVATNRHVVDGTDRVTVRLASGVTAQASVVERHRCLDLAYLQVESGELLVPTAIGDSDDIRVGETVIAIGFPLGQTLGLEPTVSVGIVSAKRGDRIQTDASLNPGNSGGPLLNTSGQTIGVVTSRLDSSGGRNVEGIAFAIPINEVKPSNDRQVSPSGPLLPTPALTIGPTPDIEATKAAIQTVDAQRQQVDRATRTAVEAQQEAERYAASLEATRIAELPTRTPEPTATPHPLIYCGEWRELVLDWVKQGNNYPDTIVGGQVVQAGVPWFSQSRPPSHPFLPYDLANQHCPNDFPLGVLWTGWFEVGYEEGQLLPGAYEFRGEGGVVNVNERSCYLTVNRRQDNESIIRMSYGEPFAFRFFEYHGTVMLGHRCGYVALYRSEGDRSLG